MITKIKLTDKVLVVVHAPDSQNEESLEVTTKSTKRPSKEFIDAWNASKMLVPKLLQHNHVESELQKGNLRGGQKIAAAQLENTFREMYDKIAGNWLMTELIFKYDVEKGDSYIMKGDLLSRAGAIKIVSPEIFSDGDDLGFEIDAAQIFDSIQTFAAKEMSEARQAWVQTTLFHDEDYSDVVQMKAV